MTAAASGDWSHEATTPEAHWRRERWADLPSPAWLLEGYQQLVVLGAHPDDETLGAGGLMAAAAEAGLEVQVVVATAGEASHPDSPVTPEQLAQVRLRELAEAGASLGTVRPHCLGLPDGELVDHHDDLVRVVQELLAVGEPTLLLAPWTGDRHPDHEAVGRAAVEVARRTGTTVLQYPVWLWQWGSSHDVPWDRAVRWDLSSAQRDRKREALACYGSQVDASFAGPEPVVTDALREAAARGFEVFWLDDPDQRVEAEMDAVHQRSEDPWQVGSRWYERRKRAVTLAALPAERYSRVLEVGCSVGGLTADLAQRAEHVTAVDVSSSSLEAARAQLVELIAGGRVSLQQVQVPWQWPEAGFYDLIVVSEVGYFLSADAWAGLVDRCLSSLTPGGVLLACHWRGETVGWPLDGDRLHAMLTSDDRLRVLVSHSEEDFWLHVLTPTEAGSAG